MRKHPLPKTFQGARVVSGKGLNYKKFDEMKLRHAHDQFRATEPTYLVLDNNALEDGDSEVVCFSDEAKAIRFAQAKANGNVDQRVVRITEHVLVIATENDL